MDSLIYAGFVLAGALTLVIEAYRNFNAPGAAHPFALHPILRTVEIRNLTTPAEGMVGFAIYAACYLVVYAVVLGSAEILQLVLSATGRQNEVGAIGTAVEGAGDPLALSGSGFEKPLMVSAALIAFLSLGAVRPVETTLRGIAHSLAGIPGGVYKVITELQNCDYCAFTNGYPTPLVDLFNQKFRQSANLANASKEKNGKAITGKENTDEANTGQENTDEGGTYEALCAEVRRSLAAIDCLTEATSPERSQIYFPLFQLATLNDLSRKLDAEIEDLRKAVNELATATSNPAEALRTVLQKAVSVRQNAFAVFAVLYVRNNRSIFVSHRDPTGTDKAAAASGRAKTASTTGAAASGTAVLAPIEAVRRQIGQRYNAELNSFAFALFLATLVGAAAIFWIYHSWTERNLWGETPRAELVWTVCGADAGATPVTAGEVSGSGVAAGPVIRCDSAPLERQATPVQVGSVLLELRPAMAQLTVFDTLRPALLILTCVFFVLIGREARIDNQSWPVGWSFRQFPFLTLLGMSFFPGLIAIVVVAVTAVLELTYAVGGFNAELVTETFTRNWIYFLMQFGTGLVLAFGALVVMDQHSGERWSVTVTMAVAFSFAVIMAFWSWGITFFTNSADPSYFLRAPEQPVTRHLRDALIFGVVPALFFLIFALLLELSESSTKRRVAAGGGARP
jgi:hypothetical protein